jgi:membrane associated rhomboid family serine protease
MVPSRFWFPVLLLGMAWCQELVDQLLFSGQWNLPMGPGLPIWGVITAPFSHSGFAHLISNSVVFLPLSWLVLTRGIKDYLAVWASVITINIPVALAWPSVSC